MSAQRRGLDIDADLDQKVIIPPSPTGTEAKLTAKTQIAKESQFYDERRKTELHAENVADRRSARTQREKYAGRVFILVSVWITAIFVLLTLQGFGATR
jgi:hypothetical protein